MILNCSYGHKMDIFTITVVCTDQNTNKGVLNGQF